MWNYINQIEIIDQVFDMNMAAGWTVKNSIASGFAGIVQCLQDVVVRNNEAIDVKTFVNMNGFDSGGCNPLVGIPSRPTKNVRIEGNVWRNNYDWAGSNGSQGSCLNLGSCENFDATIQDVTFVNNFCSSSVPAGMMLFLNCRQDTGENPGKWVFSGNTFVAEGALKFGAVLNDTLDGGAYGEDDIEFKNNIMILPPGEFAMNFETTVANLQSDYNSISPGTRFKWNNVNIGNLLSDWQSSTGGDTNSGACNPSLVDQPNGDLHLDPMDTCALDQGTSLSTSVLGDIDGDSRPQGPGWDIGADEADFSSPPGDITIPAIFITSPTSDSSYLTNQSLVDLAGNAEDNVGVVTVNWENTTTGNTGTASGCSGESACSWDASSMALVEGDNVVVVTAADSAGNESTDSLTVTYTPSDIIPPVITNISAAAQTAETVHITVSWNTDEPATSQVEYGVSAVYGSVTTIDTVLTTAHTVVLDCLDRKTTYHLRIRSSDDAGNLAVSGDQVLKTSGKPPSGGSCSP